MTAARAVALILAWVRRERARLNDCLDSPRVTDIGAEYHGRIASLDALENYILGLLPRGGKK